MPHREPFPRNFRNSGSFVSFPHLFFFPFFSFHQCLPYDFSFFPSIPSFCFDSEADKVHYLKYGKLPNKNSLDKRHVSFFPSPPCGFPPSPLVVLHVTFRPTPFTVLISSPCLMATEEAVLRQCELSARKERWRAQRDLAAAASNAASHREGPRAAALFAEHLWESHWHHSEFVRNVGVNRSVARPLPLFLHNQSLSTVVACSSLCAKDSLVRIHTHSKQK